MRYEHGWLPWKNSYGGFTRAIRYANGVVYRLGNSNTIYPVSEKMTKRFVTEVPAHPLKALIGGQS